MASIVLMGLAGILVGGGLAFRQQKAPWPLIVSFFVLAGMALLAAFLFTL